MASRSTDRGFTLIELLIVVVIIGILATIAIPKFANTKEKAYDATVKSDLRNAFVAIEAYFADSVNYPPDQAAANFQPSTGVTFSTWAVQTKNGMLSVHLHADHALSSNYFHAHYPAEGSTLDQRKK